MKNIRNITKDLYYIGANDRRIALFESVYPISEGVSYNSYLLNDDKTVLFDTVDKCYSGQFFENLDAALNGKKLDYFIINHIEPDHAALIKDVVEKHTDVKIICNQKTQQMLYQFFEFKNDISSNFQIVKEGDSINTGNHELTFVFAPMVHWPEVMVTYDKTDKILFSADAFGSFGALNGNIFDDEVDFDSKIEQYRRYYTNIVGKYGTQVKAVLSKASALEIKTICPLHGLILKENISKVVEKYSLWANYTPEINSVLVLYASVYGGTQNAAEVVASRLAQKGVKDIKMYDVSHVHSSYILADAFKYSHILVASTTYNNEIFVNMKKVLDDFVSHNLLNRTWAIVENGSWACNCGSKVKDVLSNLASSKILENKLTIKSTLKENQENEIENLAEAIVEDLK